MIRFLFLGIVFWLPLASPQTLNSTVLYCYVGDTSYTYIGSVFACQYPPDISFSTFPDSYVTQAKYKNGTLIPSEILDQIESFHFEGFSSMKFIPSGLQSIFTNMRELFILRSGLLSVNRENMMQFGSHLVYLNLYGNWLSYLDADVLIHNTHLKYLDLRNNPIRYIDINFFSNLRNLYDITVINFSGCTNKYFNSLLGHNLSTFKWNAEACSDELARIETRLAPIGGRIQHSLRNEETLRLKIERSAYDINEIIRINSIQLNFSEKFNSLTNSVNKLASDNTSGKIDKLSIWIGSLESTMEMMKNQLQSIDLKIDNFIRIFAGNTVLSNDQT